MNQKASQLLLELFEHCNSMKASDIHLAESEQTFARVAGEMVTFDRIYNHDEVLSMVQELIGQSGMDLLKSRGSIDGAKGLERDGQTHRFRFNVYRASGKLSIAFRKLEDKFRSLEELGLPNTLHEICDAKDGLILVAGPTGSGKSTTIATLIDQINQTRSSHIITVEDPIEYIHRPRQSRVTQRQVGIDTPNFHQGMVDAVRQDPDILLVGELRDLETIDSAIQIAATGHLVFATVHAGDCVGAIERIVNVFPGDQQSMIRQFLSSSLRAGVAQHLLRTEAKGDKQSTCVLANELLVVNSAVSNLIRSGNLAQIRSVMETGASSGMYTLDSCLARLVRTGKISMATARSLAHNTKLLFELSQAM